MKKKEKKETKKKKQKKGDGRRQRKREKKAKRRGRIKEKEKNGGGEQCCDRQHNFDQSPSERMNSNKNRRAQRWRKVNVLELNKGQGTKKKAEVNKNQREDVEKI